MKNNKSFLKKEAVLDYQKKYYKNKAEYDEKRHELLLDEIREIKCSNKIFTREDGVWYPVASCLLAAPLGPLDARFPCAFRLKSC
jgi:hypothetical protein